MTKLQEDTNKQRRNGIIDKNNIKKNIESKENKETSPQQRKKVDKR